MAIAGPPTNAIKPTGGVLPVSINSHGTYTSNTNKSPLAQSRQKVVVRRLAPGLVQAEFEAALGTEWKPGNGKVDWMLFRPGKVSKDLAKPSRPARAYLHVTNTSHLDALAEKVRETSFADARSTSSDTVLLGPPVLEFAPYGRVPAGKKRNDPRQGLVDQDSEFIAFLESLTNPIAKLATSDTSGETADSKHAKVTVTPLIQHLRDKKAAKEAAKEKSTTTKATKGSKKADVPETKAEAKEVAASLKDVSKEAEKKIPKPVKVERPPKVTNRPAKPESVQQSHSHTPATPPVPATEPPKAAQVTPVKKAEPPNPAAAAARMLQRDLVLRGRGGTMRRGGRQPQDAARVSIATPGTSTTSTANGSQAPHPVAASNAITLPAAATKTATDPPLSTAQQPTQTKPLTAPAIMRRGESNKPSSNNISTPKPNPSPPAATTSTPTTAANSASSITQATTTSPVTTTTIPARQVMIQPSKPKPIPAPTSTQAFLKHANPSQGITEALLNTAMQVFGPVANVEIDKRKGFAYVEFESPDGLQKAMAASPIKIAQGNVQVLERKDRAPSAIARNPPAPPMPPGPAVARGAGGVGGPGHARGGAAVGRGGLGGGPGPHNAFRGGRGSMRGRGGIGRGPSIGPTHTDSATLPAAAVSSPQSGPAESIATTPTAAPESGPSVAINTQPASANTAGSASESTSSTKEVTSTASVTETPPPQTE